MLRIVLGVISGFFAWVLVWFGSETILSALWPAFGEHQNAFQEAIENGGAFSANSTMLLTHILLASIVSMISGFVAALIAGENKRSPFALGVLLTALAFLKAAMSWPIVPFWYHFLFTAILLPMATVGGKLKGNP